MPTEIKLSIFIKHILLDATGLTIIAFGIAKLQVHVDFLPETLRFPYYGWAFVFAGLFMILPTVVIIYTYAKTTKA